MNRKPDKELEITVTIRLPWSAEPHSYRYTLDPIESEAFCKLPRDRKFDPFAAYHAQEQLHKRSVTAETVGRIIASALISYAASKDPFNGYERR